VGHQLQRFNRQPVGALGVEQEQGGAEQRIDLGNEAQPMAAHRREVDSL